MSVELTLKKYILSHPADDEALGELFIKRRNPNVQEGRGSRVGNAHPTDR